MQKREIGPGNAYGDGKKGKRLVLRVNGDSVVYRMIPMPRKHEYHTVGGEYDVKLAHFASWAVELLHDVHGYVHDADVQRSLDDDARRKAGKRKPWPPLPCARCGQTLPVETFRPNQRETKAPLCAPCEEAGWDEAYQRGQAEMKAREVPAGPAVGAEDPHVGNGPKPKLSTAAKVARPPMSRSRAHADTRHSVAARTKTGERPRGDGRVASSPENGRKGGRPPVWSPDALTAAVACLRAQAKSLADPLGQELLRLARAVEEGTLRLRSPIPQTAPSRRAFSEGGMRVMVSLQVKGGRSLRGRARAGEEIDEQVLSRFHPKREDGFDYSLMVPYTSEEDLDRTMSHVIPTAARAIAAKRHCTVEYSARSLEEPARSWSAATVPAAPVHRKLRLEVSLQCYRGKAVLQEVEERVLRRFPFDRLHDKPGDYRLTVWYTTDEDVERTVAQMLQEVGAIAHERRRSVQYDMHVVDHPQRSWSGTLA